MDKNNQNSFGGDFYSRMTQRDAQFEISERSYSMVMGGSLVWGFALTYLLCRFAGPSLLYSLAGMGSMSLILMLIAYFALTLIGSRMLHSESIASCFLGYNLIVMPVGLLLSIFVMQYDPYLITRAAMMTAIVTVGMMAISAAKPDLFESIGYSLGSALLLTIITEVIASIFFRGVITFLDWIVVGIMSMYVGFDWSRGMRVQRTAGNAIAVAASLYLDIVNIFIRLLRIFGRSSSRR